jgi:hypothetical protein
MLQESRGRSQIIFTFDAYSHVVPTMQRDAANKLDGIFRKEP